MKKWSIKVKIISWYTLFFLGLITVNIGILIIASESQIYEEAAEELREVTHEVIEDLVITSVGVFIEDDDRREPFYFFKDGINFVLYENNQILDGITPTSITEQFRLVPGAIQRYEDDLTTWYIYDEPINASLTLRAYYNYTSTLGALDGVVDNLLWIAPLLLLAAAIGGYLIIRVAFVPLNTMATTASQITYSQNYSLRIPEPNTLDEVKQLSVSLNQMISSMEESLQREKEFSANVSHELRTPLTAIRAQLEYIISKTKESTKKHELEDLMVQVHVMQETIQQMLDWSRIKHQPEDQFETIDITTLLESVSDHVDALAKERGITLTKELAEETLRVHATVSMLSRIFNNVLHNAIKFTPNNGTIHIVSQRVSDVIKITIKDSGIGMTEEQRQRVFDPFYQADPSRSHESVSLGIGLSMTQELLRQLKGSITLASTPNQGTTVTIAIPLQ